VPFSGYRDAWDRGWRPEHDFGNGLVAVAVLAIAVVIVAGWWRDRRSLLWCAALPFALLVPFLSAQVLDLSDNSLRAIGPGITFGVLAAYRTRPPRPQPIPEEAGHR
jgi:hypothetical protein